MVQFIQSNQIFSAQGDQFKFPNYPQGLNKPQLIPAESEILGYYWIVPVIINGRYQTVEYRSGNTATKPQPDAAKVLRLQFPDLTVMEIYVPDTAGTSSETVSDTFAYKANGLGGSLPVMPTVTVPYPMFQYAPISSTPDHTNTFYFSFDPNPNSRVIKIDGIWLNGVVPGVVQPTDKTSVSAYATWANSNMSDYGTWAAVNATTLSLVSATSDTVYVAKGGILNSLVPVNWCFDLTSFSTPALVNGLKFGSSDTIPLTPFMLTDDPAVLISNIQKYTGNAVFGTAVAHKLQITALFAQPKLYADSSLVSTAASGVCS